MKRHYLFGGVITGAGLALCSIVLLSGSLFVDGGTEMTMLVAAAVSLLLSVAAVGATAFVRPAARALHLVDRDLRRAA